MVCLATYTVEIRRVIDKEMPVAAAPATAQAVLGKLKGVRSCQGQEQWMDASTNRRGFRVMADVPPVLQWLGT